MKQHAPRSTWVVLLLMLVTVVWLDGYQQRHDAERWLARARAAAATLDYHGEQRVDLPLPGRRVVARVSVIHAAGDRTRLEYLAPAELAGTVAVCANGQCQRFDPQLGRSVAAAVPLALPPARVAGYWVHNGPGEPLAGRETRRLSLRRGGVRRDYWFDRETGLLLGTRGPLGDTRFTSFTLGPSATPVEWPAAAPATQPLSAAQLTAQLGFAVHEPRYVPRGFVRVDGRIYECPCCGMRAAQLVYRGALGCVSVFEQRGDQTCCLARDGCGQGGGCLAGVGAGGPVVARLDRSPLVVALGEAPRAELRRVVDSVE